MKDKQEKASDEGCSPVHSGEGLPREDADGDDFEYWLGECGKGQDGYCGKAGSEECDFECPFS